MHDLGADGREPASARRSGRARDLALGTSVAALAFAVRALAWPKVFHADRIVFPGNDPWYHARRILLASRDFPNVPAHDPLLNHPHGGEPIWPPLFDASLAALARVFGDPSNAESVERLIVWAPPVIGALTAAASACIAARLFSTTAGWAAGVGMALLPAAWSYAQIGFVDHHVAVALHTALLLATGAVLVHETSPSTRAWAAAVIAGALVAAGFALWPGTLLHLVLLDAGLAWAWVLRSERRDARVLALQVALLHALAGAALAPFAWGREWTVWGDFSPTVLTSFQPAVLWSASLGAVLAAGLSRGRGQRSPESRAGIAFASLAAAIIGFAALAPDVGEVLEDAWRWLARRESFQAEVAESQPILVRGGRPTLEPALSQLGLLFLATPLGLVWLAIDRRDDPGRLLFAMTLGLAIATLAQTRFANSFAVALSIVAAGALDATARSLGAGPRLRPLLVAGALALHFLPVVGSLREQIAITRAALEGRPVERTPLEQRRLLLIEAADWLRRATPPPADPFDLRAAPAWGVLSAWTDGHVIEYVGQRPTVVSNFGDDIGPENMRAAESYYRSAEGPALALLDDLSVRFVVVEYRRMRARRHLAPDAVLPRLFFFHGSEGDRSLRWLAGKTREVTGYFPAFTRHRLRFETGPKPWSESGRPAFQVWERVAGGRIRGRAEPRSRVEADFELETNRGRRFSWRAGVDTGSDGRYALRVPYATDGEAGDVRIVEAFLSAGDRRSPLSVSETAVMAGLEIDGPDLARPGSAP